MPKIKCKNILSSTEERICNTHPCNSTCPLHKDNEIFCIRDARYEPNDAIVELSEKDFPTNREWLESLSDEDLASFYTAGLIIEKYSPYPINIHKIIGSFMASHQGVYEWLSQPCVYLMDEE